MKTCACCKIESARTAFYNSKSSYCKQCCREKSRKTRQKKEFEALKILQDMIKNGDLQI